MIVGYRHQVLPERCERFGHGLQTGLREGAVEGSTIVMVRAEWCVRDKCPYVHYLT